MPIYLYLCRHLFGSVGCLCVPEKHMQKPLTSLHFIMVPLYKFRAIMALILKERKLRRCQQHDLEWVYHVPCYPQAAGLIERMSGLFKEKLRKLGNNSYKNWEGHLFLALQQLNNRPLGNPVPLSWMMTPNLQIRSQQCPTTSKWWAIDPNAQAPYVGTLVSAGSDSHTAGALDRP